MRARNALMLLAIAACSAADAAPTGGSGAAPATRKVTLADVGLEAASLDRSADPCVDFYQFACGGWLARTEVPADRGRYLRSSELADRTDARLTELLETDATSPAGTAQAQLGAFYASCMNTAAIESAGLAPLKPGLGKIAAVKDARSWASAIATLHRMGVQVVWSATASADSKDARTNVTILDTGALGLPDRDYYSAPARESQRAAYLAHLARTFALLDPKHDIAASEAAARDVMAVETSIAALTKPATAARNSQGQYHPLTGKALGKQTKSVDWKAYWKAIGVTPSPTIVVGTPTYFAKLDATRAAHRWSAWQHYFTYHLVRQLAIVLPAAIDSEQFALWSALSGTQQQLPRARRCTLLAEANLGESLGQQYVATQITPASRQAASDLVVAIAAAMTDALGAVPWMSAPTRTLAKQKLAALSRMVGYPDHWRTYAFEVTAIDAAGNLTRARTAETLRVLGRAGKPVDRSEWTTNAYTADAFYDATGNVTIIPAGMLQPPFFGPARSVAANLGGLGMVIGHELTHALDDEGAQFDAAGNLATWWTPADTQAFGAATTCVADQYSTFEAAPKQFVDGRLTLGENIADLGGVKIAWRAYRTLRTGAPLQDVADGFTEDQQFFLGVGQAWCAKTRPALLQQLLTTDPHAPPKFRVYGALRNLPEFAAAFQCAPGTPMNPAHSCSVW